MANYDQAFQLVLNNEGGYVNDPDDPGGETYKGIARKMNSKWPGWVNVDMAKQKPNFPGNLENDAQLQDEIKTFYRINYWDKIKGDDLTSQEVADSIFDFGVNAGTGTSARLAQMVVDATADGVIGPNSVAKINAFDPEFFLASFALAKIARYINIVKKNPSSKKYFYGWVKRTLGDNS